MDTKLEITIDKMPTNLQASYCKGRYKDNVIDCMYHNKSICTHSCYFATTLKRYEDIVQRAGMSMEVAG